MRCRWTCVLAVGGLLAVAISVPASAHAEEATPATAPAPYELDFTLPSESRSGCLVCHGDPALLRSRAGALVSFYIDEETVVSSTHVEQQCVACHIDFAYRAPHGAATWSVTAKSACRNCHDDQSKAFGTGVHRPTVIAAETASAEAEAPKPLCGDCHGSHDIAALTERGGEDWDKGKAALHARGWDVCGRCHEDYWDSYSDYYHGAAYKRGAEDAPSCWDCHGWHDILPSDDRSSPVNESHLVETCGQDGCHNGVDEVYVDYAGFIHGRPEVVANNPLHALFRTITNAFGRLVGRGDEV